MGTLADFVELVKEFQSEADFLTVYIQEAHAQDGWAFGKSNYSIYYHKTIKDRLLAADILAKKNLPCPLYIDIIEDECRLAYAAAPERLYVVQDGVIKYTGGMGPMFYRLGEVRKWLEDYRNNKKTQ